MFKVPAGTLLAALDRSKVRVWSGALPLTTGVTVVQELPLQYLPIQGRVEVDREVK